MVTTEITERIRPAYVQPRLATLAPEQTIIDRYLAHRQTSTGFVYDISNLDANGDILHTKSTYLFQGDAWPPTRPVSISSYAADRLVPFLAEMKQRHVRVLFDYTPYLIYQKPSDDWKHSDTLFQQQIRRLGGELLEQRDALFYPNTLFFNSSLHLNDEGRRARTQTLIDALRNKLR